MSIVRIVSKANNTDGWQARWPIPGDPKRRCWTRFFAVRTHGGIARAYDLAADTERRFISRAVSLKNNAKELKRKEEGMKTILGAAAVAILVAGCSDADVASKNLSKAADNFEVTRRIVFYNGITGAYMLTIEGLCSLGNASTGRNSIAVTCKVGPTSYKKHFLGLSDNVTFFAEQLEPAPANPYRYRVIFKPDVIVPDINISTSIGK